MYLRSELVQFLIHSDICKLIRQVAPPAVLFAWKLNLF